MKKKWFVCILLGFIILSQVVAAQYSGVPPGVGEEGEAIEDVTQRLQDVVDKEKWEYLAQEWKDYLLGVPAIGRINTFFENINFMFVFLFARDYSFSATLLLVLMIWLFTALSLEGYLIVVENKSYRALLAFALTIVLAHMQVFNWLAVGAFKIIFYKSSWAWGVISGIIILVAVVFYLILNRIIAKKLVEMRKEKKEKKTEHKISRHEEFYREATGE